tara:strand:+ start:1095 stop:1577 length:483 start_codon:yes stop_codon:yes gene_type:complete
MKPTTSSPKDWREGRRLRAWELKQQGWKQRAIAQALGVSEGAVSQWMRRADDGGIDALHHVPPPGAQSKLKPYQKLALCDMLLVGAEAFGFRGEVWTGPRLAALIRQYLGVSYHSDYIPRLLKRWGWSVQKPSRQAQQRDEEAIARWRTQTWPQLKKKPN